MKDVNKCIKRVKNENVSVTFPKLNLSIKDWKLIVYGDGAFANLPDRTLSSGGHIVFLVDSESRSCPLRWSVNKIQRIVRSSLASEALTLEESIEDGLFIKELLCELFREEAREIKLQSVTDNKSLKNAVYSTSMVKNKLLRINIAAIKQAMEKYKVLIDWQPGNMMIADALSKRQSDKKFLIQAVSSGYLK